MEVAEAFAGFTPGEADGLRRAMSRKRSQEMLQRHRERFVAGAQRHAGAERQTAERVWEMVEGFAGFGFPKAHGAAFGLLAYQSTWLRVHYGPEFLCALLNEQPMGFYAPDSLVHEAEHRGIDGAGPRRERLGGAVHGAEPPGRSRAGVRLGLGYIKDVARRPRCASSWPSASETGPSAASASSPRASARGAGRSSSWPGRAPATASIGRRRDRRSALWQLGVAAAGRGGG